MVIDSHVDTPTMLLEGIDLGQHLSRGHVDFVRAAEGGVDVMFFAIYTPPHLSGDQAVVHALNLISKTYDAVDSNKDKAAFAYSTGQAEANAKHGLVTVMLGMENASPIMDNMRYLELYYKFGIRYLTLCHNAHNLVCDSAAPMDEEWGGLSPFGRKVVAECNRLGIVPDCSHVSDATFYDMLKYSATPIVASHSSCRALCNHPRNMSDSMIKDLAASGGVIQINFYPKFILQDFADEKFLRLSEEGEKWQTLYRYDLKNEVYRQNYFNIMAELAEYPAPSVKRVVDHIEHAASLVGGGYVGVGSDFDGIEIAPEGLRDISMFPNLVSEMRSRGFRESDIKGIMGDNFFRVLKIAESSASRS